MEQIRVLDVNRETLRMFGAASLNQLLGGLDKVFRDEMVGPFTEQLIDLWNGQINQQREVINYTLGGELLNIHMQFAVLEEHRNTWKMVLVSLVDITARKKAEAYLEYLGKHDVLTRLRNRAYYTEELNRLTRRGPWPLSVLVIDLNGLKRINDESGHAAGDAMLRRMGEVLSKAVDAPACAARTGGDEFAVLLPGSDPRAAQTVVDRIQSILLLNNQFYPGQHLQIAIGVATCESGDQLDAALHDADKAMYVEKARFYSEVERNRRNGT
jgi:diguanylate cyclase (GGDEF)-like protein